MGGGGSKRIAAQGSATSFYGTLVVGEGEATPLKAAAVPQHFAKNMTKTQPATHAPLEKAKRKYRDPTKIATEFEEIGTDVIDFMLRMSRVAVHKSGGTHYAVESNLKTLLHRLVLLNNELNEHQQRGAHAIDPCLYVMAEQAIAIMRRELCRKYAQASAREGSNEEDARTEHLLSPMSLSCPSPWCKFNLLHAHHTLQLQMLLQIVSYLTECRSREEYELLMREDAFSSLKMLLHQVKKTEQANTASFESEGKRSDLDFHAYFQRLTAYGIKRAKSLSLDHLPLLDEAAASTPVTFKTANVSTAASSVATDPSSAPTTTSAESQKVPRAPRKNASLVALSFNRNALQNTHNRTRSLPSLSPRSPRGSTETSAASPVTAETTDLV